MDYIYKLKNYAINKEINDKNPRFLFLTNSLGSFINISDEVYTRYQGIFFNLGGNMFKIIEDIEIEGNSQESISLLYGFDYIERNVKFVNENFRLKNDQNIFCYQVSKTTRIKIIFDPREIFKYPKFSRSFTFLKQNKDLILIKYSYVSSGGNQQIYIALKNLGSENFNNLKFINSWVRHSYRYDLARVSSPSELFVWQGLSFESDGFILSVALSQEEALKNLHNFGEFNNENKTNLLASNLNDDTTLKNFLVKQCLLNSIYSLKIKNNDRLFFYAGLPWFLEFWSRDEAISFKMISKILSYDEFKSFILFRFNYIMEYNFLPTFFDLKVKPSQYISYDGTLIFLWQITNKIKTDYFKDDYNIENYLRMRFLIWLEKFISLELKGIGKLSYVAVQSQWMDSLVLRNGSLVEIEALILALLSNAYDLSKDIKWKRYLNIRKKLILKNFYDGKNTLADMSQNFDTIRPNLFLAYYFYKDLLPKKSWRVCFKKSLNELWLDWGGLASLSKKNPDFSEIHTGEDSKSYHRGDSWMFINNIAAICLNDFEDLKIYASKIFEKSLEDLLWHNALGNASELSGAMEFKPAGSPVQLWSAATLYELTQALDNKNYNNYVY